MRQQVAVEQELQHEEAGDIGLGLFDGAVELFQFLARRSGAAANRYLVRTNSVTELVRQNVHEEVIEAQVAARRRRQHLSRNGRQIHLEFRFLHVLQHDPLAALLLNHALVIGQVERGRANAVRTVASRQNFVHHADRSQRPQFRVAILRVQRETVFDLLKMVREHLQLGRLLLVAERNVSFERRLVSEDIVVVRLIRPDGHVDRRVKLHPRHVAGVIVVGKEGVGSQVEERLRESGLFPIVSTQVPAEDRDRFVIEMGEMLANFVRTGN